MSKEEVIEEVCELVSMAYHSIGDYSEPNDGFCDRCQRVVGYNNYQNSGKVIHYVRNAVLEKLLVDGHSIAGGFDPLTGREIKEEAAQ